MNTGISIRKAIAAGFLPRYSVFLDRLNWSVRWTKTVREANCPILPTRIELYRYLNDQLFEQGRQALDFLEFGVFEGVSLRHWVALNNNVTTRFFGFDSFEGLPESWNAGRPKGSYSSMGVVPDIQDDRVRFVRGWFQDSLPSFLRSYSVPGGVRLVIHNDSDLYSSTLYCLTALNAWMAAGTIVIFDEFYDAIHEYRALCDYASAYMRKYKFIGATKEFGQAAIELV